MLHPHVVVAEGETIHGKGLVATALILAGEVVSRLEPFQPHYAIADVMLMSSEEIDHVLHIAYQNSATTLVAEQGDERFMNHSCDPTTWWADDNTLVARRDIQPGEELTYDYATTDITIPFEMTCRCGAANCRGVVTNLDHLNPDWQRQYGEMIPAHTLAAVRAASNAGQDVA
ncbi:MAG: SET domain-containing protein-lysine N-methyltransferase [Chloroflexi bacterium]|jgi:hypothetical protein|nr:MAG: SET domain protein [Chloroflexi bacterium OLB13]MBC6955737.1 SET domain-containing protein-lysine N-methyltransferase [Chloroflexota bacterium]MBV6435712.1 hypothetical protein [Anaerolineae bacterium]MDL1914999.1 SET domain-containing protein-lysine N-methyltransferase [Anaerolineae bacterium CFX4]OQY80072.1 MAG: hypothetical protein B6D42_13635 [Anaerolineae bacterium UTCFX5]